MSFPVAFKWGAAAAAFQIEGGDRNDGRGLSVWDVFCEKEGAVFGGHDGRIACDHYHRWKDDIALMRELGLQAYRLSISWPRVLPNGLQGVNEEGLRFYDQLIDGLLDAGITPFVTLFHWDLPYELQCQGGWLNPKIADWFAGYAGLIADRFGDRVRHWMTLNEPQVYLSLGYREGVHAPGLKLGWRDVLRCVHHSLLAHGRAVQVLRERCKLEPIIGWAPVGEVSYPVTHEPEDVAAARRQTCSASERNLWNNTLFSDPILLGQYPEDALRTWHGEFPAFTPQDMRLMHQKIDFYGVNIYRGKPVRCGIDGMAVPADCEPGVPINASYWNVTPAALYWGPRFIYERYKLPIYVTENGFSGLDWVSLDGQVHDPQRIDFTRRYLMELGRAIEDGVDVRGYFHWSVMDNFEWDQGYRQRFGLVHVDYRTQKRTPKDSAKWYASLIRNGGVDLKPAHQVTLFPPPSRFRRNGAAVADDGGDVLRMRGLDGIASSNPSALEASE
jgi:beta-glucosidase